MLRTEKGFRKVSLLLAFILIIAAVSVTKTVKADEEGQDLYFGALEQTEIKKINTTKVEKGTFFITGAINGTVSYDSVSYIFAAMNEGKVIFNEFCVMNGNYVKRGDPIASVTVEIDREELTELKMKLAREEKNLDEYINDTKQLLESYRYASENAENEEERRMGSLAYEKLQADYDTEVYNRKAEIAEEETRLDLLLEAASTEYICADMDGYVANLNRLRRGNTLNYYEYICTIVDKSSVTIVVDDTSELLRYNMPVKITQTNGNDVIELTGRVLTLKSTSISNNLSARRDVIEVYGDPSGLGLNKDVVIRFDRVYVPDALMVSKSAVHTDNRGSYVNVRIDGYSCKKYVVVGGTNAEKSWIAFGVEEGDEIIVD